MSMRSTIAMLIGAAALCSCQRADEVPGTGDFVDLRIAAGCEGDHVPGDEDLFCAFSDLALMDGTSNLVVFALEPGNHACGELVTGDVSPGDCLELSRTTIEHPYDGMVYLRRVPEGEVLFVAEGYTEEGASLVRGCAKARVPIRPYVTVEMVCVCEPVPGTCGPVDEVMDNGIDDDCDLLTDECDTRLDCDDANGCTQDFCIDSVCQWQNWPDGTRCSDGDRCTVDDGCRNGVCSAAPRDCSGLGGLCTEGVCDPGTGQCGTRPVADGTACEDGLFCTLADACLDGTCTGTTRDCDDSDPCTLDTCDETTKVCAHERQPIPGAEGPEGDPTCSNGLDDDCDGLTDGQDPNCAACQEDGECDDGNPCTDDVCDAGDCRNNLVSDGIGCDDGRWCTDPDTCTGGVCGGPARDCSHVADTCHEGLCDEGSGQCIATPKPDGTGCDDGQWCTISDACDNGECAGTARDCSDGDDCTEDICDEAVGQCRHELQPDPGAEGPEGDPSCGNGVDDDCDGLTDTGDPDCTGLELTWIALSSGTYQMGSEAGNADEQPVHQVSVPDFELTGTEITVAQYQVCVDHGACTPPVAGGDCNWGVTGRGDHPVNCVEWHQAVDFCAWAGGRLPSEAEWEYAATSRGQETTYPWGDEPVSCSYAVMDDGTPGCGLGRTWNVCGKPAGNTTQGLCDMAGNVYEWVGDWYHDSYQGAPADGSAWESPAGEDRVARGGSWLRSDQDKFRATHRYRYAPDYSGYGFGFRCAR